MRISFIVNYIEWGFSPWDKRIGGSEEFVVEVSKRLADRGHNVTVYHNGRHGLYEGVSYKDYEQFDYGGVLVNVNYPEFGGDIFWTSLDKNPKLDQFKVVCGISQYQIDNCGIEHKDVRILPPGYNQDDIYPSDKVKKQCLYASSPDRGLDTLLRAWTSVHAAHPDATLIVTYGAQEYDIPNVEFVDATSDEMNYLYRTSDIWCHPANGGELYCISGIKAQAAGCWPVVIPTMALSETVRYGTMANKDNYADKLIEALTEHPEPLQGKYPTWDDATDQLEQIIKEVVNL
ncbi:hypothetical protein KDA08_05500 [Candidatus Saccharibacteria bacterium]|nr:hypothetical protein [Candidatus Saccharibacteria bacterium]